MPAATGSRAPLTLALLQRERELDALREAFAAARRGHGTLTLVTAAAGTGKTALLAAAAEEAAGLAVRRARGTEIEQELSFGVVRQLLEPLIRSLPAEEREEALVGSAAPVARIVDAAPVAADPGADGGFATLNGLYWMLATVAAKRPLALLVDDAHWADSPSLRALVYLAGRITDLPVALVVSLRPNEPSAGADLVAALEAQPQAQQLELRPLTPEAVASLVRDELPQTSEDLSSAFHEASGGNPFYLRELLRSFGVGGEMPAPADVRAASVSSVGDRVLRRLRALGPDAPQLAAAMAVLGSVGRLGDAADVADQDAPTAAATAAAMARIELLATEDPFEWIHPLVRRSVYDSLNVAERDALHARAADVLERAGADPGVVAAHLSAERPTGSVRVATGLLRAAESACSRDAPEDAAAMLQRALAEAAAEPSRAALLMRLGQIEVTRRNPAAVEYLREALDLLVDPRERAFAAMALGEILVHDGHWDESAAVVTRALGELGDSDDELALELDVSRALLGVFDPALAGEVWQERPRLRALAAGERWAAHALAAMLALLSAFRGEHLDDVVPLCERAIAGGTLVSQRGAGAWAPAHVLGALITIEEYERAETFAAEVAEAASAQGSVANALTVDTCRGWAVARLGDLTRAEELLRGVQSIAQENGMLLMLVTILWYGRDLLLERESQGDMAAVVEGVEMPEAFAEAAGGAWLMATRGRLRASRGEREGAEADLRAVGRICERLGFGPLHDPWRSALALVLPAERAEEARALAAAELALAEASGLARPCGVALRASGLLADDAAGIDLLRSSVAVLESSPARYEHARSLVALGSALRRRGHRAESREPLAAGLELAHRCGAERLTAHAREELVVGGGRPRRIVRSGFDALTASERRIVRLAVDGASNGEIAQALYVSVKTVETHLSNAYGKLGLAGPGARRRLAKAIASGVS
jgi:DNA-binding CsgD family transcriptional regulator